jgi:diguanylate cyclase (GGDEF)-like protein
MLRKFRLIKSKLSIQLLARILLASSLITAINVAVQVYWDYTSEKSRVLTEMENVVNATKSALRYQLKSLNKIGTQKLVDSIANFDSISHVQVRAFREELGAVQAIFSNGDAKESIIIKVSSASENSTASPVIVLGEGSGEADTIEFFSEKIPGKNVKQLVIKGSTLLEAEENKGVKIYLAVFADMDKVEQKVLENLSIIIVNQAVKTFLVSIFILLLIHQLVIRHVTQVTKWLSEFNPRNTYTPMKVNKIESAKNELDELKTMVCAMGEVVHKHTTSLESIVRERTSELEKAKAQLETLAYTDSLTSLSNRLAFFNQAESELKRARRLSYKVGVMMLDLDLFKLINDNYGHDAGDEVLINVSQALRGCLREEDCIGRIGGEEFAIVVPGADKTGMHNLAIRLQNAVQALDFEFFNKDKKVTISIGYTEIKTNETFKDALKRSDEHLYSAKQNGRNCFVTDPNYSLSAVL